MLATDLLLVIGFSFAYEILFHKPLYVGVLLSLGITLLILSLQYFKVRYLEIIVILLILIMSVTFFIQWSLVGMDGVAIMKGWIIPSFPNGSALIIGSSVMLHNIFLQSSMVQTRKMNTKTAAHSAFIFNLVEFLIPMMLAFILNLVISHAASTCNNGIPIVFIVLIDACHLIKKVYPQNGVGCILFGLSLTSAQTATISVTYAGQIVMESFLPIRTPLWLRSLITRSITIIPGLIVTVVASNSGTGLALLIASSILSLQFQICLCL
eukprot:jgi/Galph1/3345/GphlegSOOS_G2064.1